MKYNNITINQLNHDDENDIYMKDNVFCYTNSKLH